MPLRAEIGQPDIPVVSGPAARALGFLDLIARRRKLLLAFVLWGFVLSVVLAFVIPVRYQSVTRLMPPDQTSGMSATMLSALSSKAGDSVGSLASDLLGMHTTGATLVGILTSRTVQDDLIDRFDLRKVYSERRYEGARKVLSRRTDISEDRKSGIITIKVEDHDRDRAARIARGYVDDLNGRVSQLTTSSARRERVFLEGRLSSIKQQLDESTLQLSRFSSKNKTFDPQVEGKAMLDAASSLQGELIAAESELKGLEQIYGPENARVRSAAARVSELRSKLNGLSGNSGVVAKDGEASALYPSLQQLPILGNTYYDLARQAKINETVYEVLTRQYELAKVEEAKEIPTIKVLDEAIAPEQKIWPPRTLIVILGTILAFCLGVTWLTAKDAWDALDADHPYKLLWQQLCKVVALDSRHRQASLRS
ncbi:MAG: GNVR domain-containing protein [Candidatus Korobacteraceae bacterium]